jgi:transcriptional regulator with XRE-family HTH domain
MNKANQDIRDYMADHGVSQRDLAGQFGVAVSTICNKLKTEMSEKDKEEYLNLVDAIASKKLGEEIPAEEIGEIR